MLWAQQDMEAENFHVYLWFHVKNVVWYQDKHRKCLPLNIINHQRFSSNRPVCWYWRWKLGYPWTILFGGWIHVDWLVGCQCPYIMVHKINANLASVSWDHLFIHLSLSAGYSHTNVALSGRHQSQPLIYTPSNDLLVDEKIVLHQTVIRYNLKTDTMVFNIQNCKNWA